MKAYWAGILLLTGLGCEKHFRARQEIYVPQEVGLTLIYESPMVDQKMRFEARVQQRLAKSRTQNGITELELNFSTLRGVRVEHYRSHGGGFAILSDDRAEFQILPQGFPDCAPQWDTKEFHCRILGRSRWAYADKVLPAGHPGIGVWVEFIPLPRQEAMMRAMYLPGIGEAETHMLREGRWVCTNRLVSRGFTEDPSVQKAKEKP